MNRTDIFSNASRLASLSLVALGLAAPCATLAQDRTAADYSDVCEKTVLQPETALSDRVFSDDFEYYSEPFAPPFAPVCVVNDFGGDLATISKVDVNRGSIPMLVAYRNEAIDIYMGALADPAAIRSKTDPFASCQRQRSAVVCSGRPDSTNLFRLVVNFAQGQEPRVNFELADLELASLEGRGDISTAFADFDDTRPAILKSGDHSITFDLGFIQRTSASKTSVFFDKVSRLPPKTVVELILPIAGENGATRSTKFIAGEFKMIAQMMRYLPKKIPAATP